jgi:hypothetical protein
MDQSNQSSATHVVLMMMVVVDAMGDDVAHLRQLRNQIVFESQNFSLYKSENNFEQNTCSPHAIDGIPVL